jgi:hypothetical protein
MGSFIKHLQEAAETLTLTENGAIALNSTGNHLVDLFGIAGAIRSRSDEEVYSLFEKAFIENPLLATKLAFYTRNVRGGLGERKTGKALFSALTRISPETIIKNMHLIPIMGRWDDLYHLVGTGVSDHIWRFIRNQWDQDLINYSHQKSISLMAKWLATPDTSNAERRRLGRLTARKLKLSLKEYTKNLRMLRKYIDVVEVKMSNQDWNTIAYHQVPSKAMMNYRNTFQRHNQEGFSSYLKALFEGKTKINSSTLYPYELMERMGLSCDHYSDEDLMKLYSPDLVLEKQWYSLPNYVSGDHNILIMADTSGSMNGRPMATSIGLAVYFAERNSGEWKNKFMTFSEKPSFVELKGNTLSDKVNCIPSIVENTDLELAFELVLDTAVKNKVPSYEMPTAIIVISDMEIDTCTNIGPGYMTFYDAMKKRFKDYNYQIPNIVFWNVASRQNIFHTGSHIPGVQLASGSSLSVFKDIVNNIGKTAYEAMIQSLSDPLYDMIEV